MYTTGKKESEIGHSTTFYVTVLLLKRSRILDELHHRKLEAGSLITPRLTAWKHCVHFHVKQISRGESGGNIISPRKWAISVFKQFSEILSDWNALDKNNSYDSFFQTNNYLEIDNNQFLIIAWEIECRRMKKDKIGYILW